MSISGVLPSSADVHRSGGSCISRRFARPCYISRRFARPAISPVASLAPAEPMVADAQRVASAMYSRQVQRRSS